MLACYFFSPHIERLLLILFTAEYADIDEIVQGHGRFSAIRIGQHLARFDIRRHLVFSVGGLFGRQGLST